MMAAKVAVVRLGTVGLTVWLMQRYAFFRRAPGDPLRFFAYVLNGLIAAAATVGISLLFHLGDADPLGAATGGDVPLILLSFMLCTALALCCDDWVSETLPPVWLRLAEAAGCAMVMALGMGIVVLYLDDDLSPQAQSLTGAKLIMLFAFPSVMAFVIGACVPHIYRSARRAATARRDEATELAAPVPPAPQPSAREAPSPGRRENGLGTDDGQRQYGEKADDGIGREGRQMAVGGAAHRIRA